MKTVFITNRGGTHPNRLLYFDSIQAGYQYVDFKVQWNGRSSSRFRMILSGIVCAALFPKRKTYDLFVSSDPQLPVVLMKWFRLLRSNQRIAVYLGSQTLYFIRSNYFSKLTSGYNMWLLRHYDAFICNGELQAKWLSEIIDVSPKKVFINFNGIGARKREQFAAVRYSPDSVNVLFIANLYAGWRHHYKGVDLLLESFNILMQAGSGLTLTIVGNSGSYLNDEIERLVSPEFRNNVELVAESNDLAPYFSKALLYVHPSRGDALPNVVTEAMFCGVPVILSNLTGGYERVEAIDGRLVCESNVHSVVEAVSYFLQLPHNQKQKLSSEMRAAVASLTSEAAVERFKDIVYKIGIS